MPGFSDSEIQELELRRIRFLHSQRRLSVIGIFAIAASAVGYLVLSSFVLFSELRLWLLISCVTLFLVGLSLVLWQYLRGGFSDPRYDKAFYGGSSVEMLDYTAESNDELRQELKRLRSDLAGLQAGKFAGEFEHVTAEFRDSITSEIVKEIEKRLSDDALAKAQLQEFRITFANSYTRLAAALAELNRRGNLNLVIGVITTILAASVLAYMALKAPPFTTVPDILSHYIPRLSTVIFIEVFSFFFLRLYKATLNESKFYQMELIAMARVDLAIQAALRSADAPAMAALVVQLSANRNGNADAAPGKPTEFDAKGFAEILEKVGKLAVEVGKQKA